MASPIPYALHEGRTSFRCGITIDVFDKSIFEALLTKGKYSDTYKGFSGTLTFLRGADANDQLKIGLGPSTTLSVTNPGCFLKNVPNKVVETPLIALDLEIEVPTMYFEVIDSLTSTDYE
jgi:hypothetical protein